MVTPMTSATKNRIFSTFLFKVENGIPQFFSEMVFYYPVRISFRFTDSISAQSVKAEYSLQQLKDTHQLREVLLRDIVNTLYDSNGEDPEVTFQIESIMKIQKKMRYIWYALRVDKEFCWSTAEASKRSDRFRKKVMNAQSRGGLDDGFPI